MINSETISSVRQFVTIMILLHCFFSNECVYGSPYIPLKGAFEAVVSNLIYFGNESKELIKDKDDISKLIIALERQKNITESIIELTNDYNRLPNSYPIWRTNINIEYGLNEFSSMGVASSVMKYYQYTQGDIIGISLMPFVKYNLYHGEKYTITVSTGGLIQHLADIEKYCNVGISLGYSSKSNNIKYFNYYDFNLNSNLYYKINIVAGSEYKEKVFVALSTEYLSNTQETNSLDSNTLKTYLSIGTKLSNLYGSPTIYLSYCNEISQIDNVPLSQGIQIGLQYK